jgi:hypothetical protein
MNSLILNYNYPLHTAVSNNNYEKVKKLLLIDNSLAKQKNNLGELPLHVLFRNDNNINIQILNLLLHYYSDGILINSKSSKDVSFFSLSHTILTIHFSQNSNHCGLIPLFMAFHSHSTFAFDIMINKINDSVRYKIKKFLYEEYLRDSNKNSRLHLSIYSNKFNEATNCKNLFPESLFLLNIQNKIPLESSFLCCDIANNMKKIYETRNILISMKKNLSNSLSLHHSNFPLLEIDETYVRKVNKLTKNENEMLKNLNWLLRKDVFLVSYSYSKGKYSNVLSFIASFI